MTTSAQDVLKAVRTLSPQEQIEVLQGLAESLTESVSPLTNAAIDFWSHRSIEDLANEQHILEVKDLQELVMEDWPDTDTVDDLIGFVREQRRADHMS